MVSKMEVDEEDSDQTYLLSRARKSKTQSEALSWMITAKLMFPEDLNIQFEAYLAEKRGEKVKESAKYLLSMYNNFPNDPRVWKELNAMIDALLLSGSGEVKFGPLAVFEAFPSDFQEKIIHEASLSAYENDGVQEYVRLCLYSIEQFPNALNTQAPEMLRRLLTRVSSNGGREMESLLSLWIHEVAPKILSYPALQLEPSILKDLVHLTLHDYVYKACILDQDSRPSWEVVFKILVELGDRLGWSLSATLETDPLEVSLSKINAISHKGKSESVFFQVYAVSLALFLKSFYDYMEETSTGNSSGESNFVLVEAFLRGAELEEGRSKRRRTHEEEVEEEEWDRPLISSSMGERGKHLMDHFHHALQLYQVLHSQKDLEVLFSRLLESKGASKALTNFSIDCLIYESKNREALQILRQLPTPQTVEEQGRFHLKMATVHYCLKDSHATVDQIIQALACLPSQEDAKRKDATEEGNEDTLTRASPKNRHLHFLHYSRKSILGYVTRILLHLLREKGLQEQQLSEPLRDLTLGHLIVLLQYSWPHESDLFYTILHRIRMKESFIYPMFCTYVIEIEFLEEFMWLASEQGGSVALDICTRSQPTPTSGRRVGTRGANRGEKEEFKSTIRKQVSRCHEDLDKIIIEFLNSNKDSIFQCLN